MISRIYDSPGGILAAVVDLEALMQPGELPPSLLDLIRRPARFSNGRLPGGRVGDRLPGAGGGT